MIIVLGLKLGNLKLAKNKTTGLTS